MVEGTSREVPFDLEVGESEVAVGAFGGGGCAVDGGVVSLVALMPVDEGGVFGVAGCAFGVAGVMPGDSGGLFGVAGCVAGDWAVWAGGLVVVDGWGVFDVAGWCVLGVIGALTGGGDGVELGRVVGVGVAVVGAAVGAVAVVAAVVVESSAC
ncbi:hypothetical protein [Nocardia sp. NPDC060249]|uniref:hypothetical protein n=1 Tax=Nocardia sp. NPDC060249 TaxID=3347082 RepID=UPI0036638363